MGSANILNPMQNDPLWLFSVGQKQHRQLV